MNSRILFCFVWAALASLMLLAPATRAEDCGTTLNAVDVEAIRALLDEPSYGRDARSTDFYDLPIAMHIVRQSNGTGGIGAAEVTAAIDSANILFAQVNVAVYEIQPVNFIDEDYFYFDVTTDGQMDSLKRYDKVPNAVNIYWVPSASNFPYCGISSFPSSGVQGIIMSNNCGGLLSKNSTLVHEIGHYFNLMHTHETYLGTECPSGSNCAIAGDLVCDTPADPNVSGHVGVAPGCLYDDFASPPGGCDATPYNPPVDNIMSYSRQSCRDVLTVGQIDRFRYAVEKLRPELATVINGVLISPLAVNPLIVPLATKQDSAIVLQNLGVGNVTFGSATSVFGNVDVTGGTPVTLMPTQSASVTFEYDALALTSSCDLGVVSDTIVITATAPTVWEVRIPVTVNIAYAAAAQDFNTFSTSCLQLGAPNTPALGDRTSTALVDPVSNVLYDGSLLLGMVDGFDTTVYMDMFAQSDYLAADGFAAGVDAHGRATQTLRFATTDARLSGEVIYHFGGDTGTPDSCQIIEIEYRVRNECDTALQLAAGIAGDFDIDGSGSNNARIAAADYLVLVEQGAHAAGFANLTPCPQLGSLRTISNAISVYPNNSLVDGATYTEMVSPNSGDLLGQDVSILISFGRFNLPSGGERTLRAALMTSQIGMAGLQAAAAALRSSNPPGFCYLEVPQVFGKIQDAITASADGDTIVIAPGTYAGLGNKDLDFQGKKVVLRGAGPGASIIDCAGTSGSPSRGFRFDNAAENRSVVVEGLTIKNGYAPADGPGARPEGGAVIIMNGASPIFRNCRFESSHGARNGGAVAIEAGSNPLFDNCVFVGNSVGTDWGGAIYLGSTAAAQVVNCSFQSNSAVAGGALALDNSASLSVGGSQFVGNNAQYAGVVVCDASAAEFTGCIFADNFAAIAAGVGYSFNETTPSTFTNCTFVGNFLSTPSPNSASVYYAQDAPVECSRCIFYGNTGDEVLICDGSGAFTIACSDMFGNAAGNWTGCVAGQAGSSGNFSADPIFCNLAGDDYRVRSSSPCAPANNSCAVLIGAGAPACGNTPAGSDVAVAVTDSVTVTFATVTDDGETSVAISSSGPNPPAGFEIVPSNPEAYYNITTTAPFAGVIEICVNYDPAQVAPGNEADLKLFHYDGSNWDDITTAIDETNNVICGETTTLSPFIVARPGYVCGDADGTAIVTISDAVYLISYIFAGGPAPIPMLSGDSDCSGTVNISDAVYLINYIFAGGPTPCAACP